MSGHGLSEYSRWVILCVFRIAGHPRLVLQLIILMDSILKRYGTSASSANSATASLVADFVVEGACEVWTFS